MVSPPPTAMKVMEIIEAMVPPIAWPDRVIGYNILRDGTVTLSQGVHVSLWEPSYEGGEGTLEDGVVDVE